eukprot:GEMP01033903.1.p1 GENE.GEMP01033903.1~~GEMP01033903.1.p1  ORF type:complete len:544 (+),score=143.11 GEMP01033903.1:41-1672(+)
MSYQTGLSIAGDRHTGQDVRSANVTAVMTLSNILKTSLGPQGLDKMLVDDIGDVTITNDGATILRKLEVEHPAAKVLVELAYLQDAEVGDGTTSVVIIAAELLKRANQLVKQQIHPTTIISGYRKAMKESIKYIQENLGVKTETLGEQVFQAVAKTTLSSKFVGGDSEFFSKLVCDAVLSVKMVNAEGKVKYPVHQINILKSHGKSAHESTLVPNGYALALSRAGQQMPMLVSPAKIALLDFDLKKHQMRNVEIRITDPDEVEKIRQKEMDITKEKIKLILDAGVNCIFTSRGIDDMCIKYLAEGGCMGVRRVDKKDLKRLAKATGARICLTLATMDGGEAFDTSAIGKAEEVVEDRVGDNDHIFIKGCAALKATTLLLRGANEYMLDEVERSVHDALMAVSKTMESKSVVPGGGAVETAVSIYLEDYARKIETREQLAIAEFADALLTIPTTLTVNAAMDSIEMVSKLRVCHHAAMTDPSKKNDRFMGADLINNGVFNALDNGVVEPMMSKLKSLKFATEAAITILRIDDLIKLDPEPERQQ